MTTKPLDNTNVEQAKAQTNDLKVFGNGDTFRLICKASSKSQGWMKSTKAMQIDDVGCVVQVTTEFRDVTGQITNCAEAITFVPDVEIGLDAIGNPMLVAIKRDFFPFPSGLVTNSIQHSNGDEVA